MTTRLLVALALALGASFAHAECYLEGRTYDEGEVVSGYVCSEGEWKPL